MQSLSLETDAVGEGVRESAGEGVTGLGAAELIDR